jgi:hypothetical protein
VVDIRSFEGVFKSRLIRKASIIHSGAAKKNLLAISAFRILAFRTGIACIVGTLAVIASFELGTVARAQVAATPQMPAGWRFTIFHGRDYLWTSPPDARGSTIMLFIAKNMTDNGPLPLKPWFQSHLFAILGGSIGAIDIDPDGSDSLVTGTFPMNSPKGATGVASAYPTQLGNQLLVAILGPGIDENDPRYNVVIRTMQNFIDSRALLKTGGMVVAPDDDNTAGQDDRDQSGNSQNCRQVLVQNNSPTMRQVCSPTGDGSSSCHLETTTSQQQVWQKQCD